MFLSPVLSHAGWGYPTDTYTHACCSSSAAAAVLQQLSFTTESSQTSADLVFLFFYAARALLQKVLPRLCTCVFHILLKPVTGTQTVQTGRQVQSLQLVTCVPFVTEWDVGYNSKHCNQQDNMTWFMF